MVYTFDSPLPFGKYKGWTVRDIYCGWDFPTLEFLSEYIRFRMSQADVSIEGSTPSQFFKVIDYAIGINNLLRINYQDSMNATQWIVSYLTMLFQADEQYPERQHQLSANDFILSRLREQDQRFKLLADPDYIFWCLSNHDGFCLSEADVAQLETLECNAFWGLQFQQITPNLFSYTVSCVKGRRAISDVVKGKNLRKYDAAFYHGSAMDDYYEDRSYSKYGGAHGFDDDTIGTAFEGDPDNCWNVD
jgi:hypothetical protein